MTIHDQVLSLMLRAGYGQGISVEHSLVQVAVIEKGEGATVQVRSFGPFPAHSVSFDGEGPERTIPEVVQAILVAYQLDGFELVSRTHGGRGEAYGGKDLLASQELIFKRYSIKGDE